MNAHAHSAMYLFKGYGDDNELMDWLRMLSDQRDYAIEHYIWPMEEMFVTPQFIEDVGCCIVSLLYRDLRWHVQRCFAVEQPALMTCTTILRNLPQLLQK